MPGEIAPRALALMVLPVQHATHAGSAAIRALCSYNMQQHAQRWRELVLFFYHFRAHDRVQGVSGSYSEQASGSMHYFRRFPNQ